VQKAILLLIGLGVVAALVGVLSWYANKGNPTFADADDIILVKRGKAIYGEHCGTCHGKNLEGQPNWRQRSADGRLPAPPHDETGHTWHHSDAQLFEVTKRGSASIAGPGYQSDMAAFAEVLNDAEIWAVLAYIKSRWPAPVRQRSAVINGKAK
jgi:mono/diheme cytochrome c family protein